MHAGQAPLHYAPSSVGALMDPVFLRGAVLDADGDRHDGLSRWPPMPPRLRAALRVVRVSVAHLRRR